jgi:hypothetical protein
MGFRSLAKKLDVLLASKQIREASQHLSQCKKGSQEFLAAYRAMDSAFKQFIILNVHFTVLRSDGRCLFSSENNAQWVMNNTDDFNTRLEVNQAMNYHHGNGVLDFSTRDKKRISSTVQKLMLKGYGSAKRVGYNSGKLEIYVAKCRTPKGFMIPADTTTTFRVSEKEL